MSQDRDNFIGVLIGVANIILLIVASTWNAPGLTNDREAVRALEDQGFSNVQVLDRHTFYAAHFSGCDEHDSIAYEAHATNPAGKEVDVLVCTGMVFKGATIRSLRR